MHILICAGIFPPEAGGPATYSKNLALALVERGHSVRVITYSDEKLEDDYPFEVISITRGKFRIWRYFKYFQAVKKYGHEADILYAQDPVSAGYPTYLAAKVLKKPFALKITGDYSWEQAQGRGLTDKLIDEFQTLAKYPSPIKRIRDIQIRVCKNADVVITPSEYLKNLVISWGVKANRIRVVYNAIGVIPEINRVSVREEFGLKDQDFLIVSVGRKVRWKGFKVLEETSEELMANYPRIKLEILSQEGQDIVFKYLKAADVFVLNTGYEGFPHVVLEAMALMAPVITTNVCGNPEIIRDGYNGILVEYNNKEQLQEAILRLYQDRDLREELVRNSKETLKKFTMEEMINKTEKMLKECAS